MRDPSLIVLGQKYILEWFLLLPWDLPFHNLGTFWVLIEGYPLWLYMTCLHYWISHRGMTWLNYITDTSQNKHRGTIHEIYKWVHSEVTNTSTINGNFFIIVHVFNRLKYSFLSILIKQVTLLRLLRILSWHLYQNNSCR